MKSNLLPVMAMKDQDKLCKLLDLGLSGIGTYYLIIELQKNQPRESDYKLQVKEVMSWFKEFDLNWGLALKVMNTPELFVREGWFVYCPETQKELLKKHNKRKFNSYAGKISAAKRKAKKLERAANVKNKE